MQPTLAILGSTGSIGTQALEIAALHNNPVLALTADCNAALLEEQIRKFQPKMAALRQEGAANDLRIRVRDTQTQVLSGAEGILACAACGADMVINSIVGIAGLAPTMAAIAGKSNLALANKETLVAGGKFVMDAAKQNGIRILPVDSEHSAIFQSLQGCHDHNEIRRLILTASGGPFFGKSKAELQEATLAQALKHPNWSMGAKITVDSATMMNKGLELIEAVWLFSVQPSQVDVLIHRQSVVHSLVEFCDHSVIAQLGVPDMRVPIQYALTYPARKPSPVPQLELAQWGSLTFEAPDNEAFPAINLCRSAINQGGLAPAAANAANEQANALFRAGKLQFLDVIDCVQQVLEQLPQGNEHTLDDVFLVDQWARDTVRKFVH